jgi:hypothetical protein
VFLVVALLAVGSVIAVRLVAAAGADAPSPPGAAGASVAFPDTPALGATGATSGGPTGPTGSTGPVACPPRSEPLELDPPTVGERTAAAALTADYRLQDSAASSVGTAPDLVPIGRRDRLIFDDDAVSGQVVLSFSDGSGLSLTPTDGVIDDGLYTIELVFLFRDVTGWAKILDFRGGLDDIGLYSLDGCLNLYPDPTTSTTAIRANRYVHVVLTRDGSARVIGYVNGARRLSIRDGNEFAVIDDDTLWFFRDDRATDVEFADGAVARIRLYDRPLTAGEVAALACGELREILSLRTCGPG